MSSVLLFVCLCIHRMTQKSEFNYIIAFLDLFLPRAFFWLARGVFLFQRRAYINLCPPGISRKEQTLERGVRGSRKSRMSAFFSRVEENIGGCREEGGRKWRVLEQARILSMYRRIEVPLRKLIARNVFPRKSMNVIFVLLRDWLVLHKLKVRKLHAFFKKEY